MSSTPKSRLKSRRNKTQPQVQTINEIGTANMQKRLIVVLDQAGLDVSRRTSKPQLLNFEDHGEFIQERLKMSPDVYQPQAVHQCLLNLMDSPLNKDGYLTVFIKTIKGRVIQLSNKTRVPRTYPRFAPLIAQLLNKQKIVSPDDGQMLLKVSREPLQHLLPQNSLRVEVSSKGNLVNLNEYLRKIDLSQPVAFFIKMSNSNILQQETERIHERISISKYPLTPCYEMTRILLSFQDLWKTV